jgi:hypothetical protein
MLPRRFVTVIVDFFEQESNINFDQPPELLAPKLEQWFTDQMDCLGDITETYDLKGYNFWVTKDIKFLFLILSIFEIIEEDINWDLLARELCDEKYLLND